MREIAADMYRVTTDLNRAREAAGATGVPRRQLRARASLVIRCNDCDGQVVAHVTYLRDRPLLWAREDRRGKRDGCLWVDGRFWGTYAWCDVREWVLDLDDVRGSLPPLGAKPVTVPLSHNGVVGAVR